MKKNWQFVKLRNTNRKRTIYELCQLLPKPYAESESFSYSSLFSIRAGWIWRPLNECEWCNIVGPLMSGWGQSFGRFFLTVPCLLGGPSTWKLKKTTKRNIHFNRNFTIEIHHRQVTVETGRLSMDPHCLLYILVDENVPLAPAAELSRLLNASVVFFTRTLSEPIRRNPAAASFSVRNTHNHIRQWFQNKNI